MHAAGGMMTTTADLARWLIVNMNEGRIDGRQVLGTSVSSTDRGNYTTSEAFPGFTHTFRSCPMKELA